MMSPIQHLLTIGAVASAVFAAPTPAEIDGPACAPLPHGSGLIPKPDTAEAFQSFAPFARAATSAATPIGYVQAYSNLLTTFNEPSQFVRYMNLDSYDVQKCATECNSEARCNAFAIFFERSPLLKPGKGCENPGSSTLIKCTMWSGTILPNVAVNKGQMRTKFSVVMAGSNAYVKDIAFDGDKNITPVVPKGWATQNYSNGAAILAPLDCHGVDTYMGMSYWRDGKFDAQRCTNACEAAGKTDLQNRKCNFVNTYMLRKNGVPVSQHCAMFSQYWPALFATNTGQLRGPVTVEISTDSYGIRRSDVKYTACYNLPTSQTHVSLPSPTMLKPPTVVPTSLNPSLPAIVPSSLIPSLPTVPPSSLIPSLPTILPPSLIPSLPTNLDPSLIPSLPTTVPSPLIPSLPAIVPSLPTIVPSLPTILPSYLLPSLPRILNSSLVPSLPTTLLSSRISSFPTPILFTIPPLPIDLHRPPFILPRAASTSTSTVKTLSVRSGVPSPTPVPIAATATTAPAPAANDVENGDMILVFETAPSAYSTTTIISGSSEKPVSRTTMTVDPYLTPGVYTFPTPTTVYLA